MLERRRDSAAGDYRELLERVPAILYIADTGSEGRWHFVSPQIEEILGFTPEEWCADPKLWVAQLHPLDRERVLAAEAKRQSPSHGDAAEYRMLRRDGEVVWIRDDAQLLFDAQGRLRWHGVLSDISHRKRAEA